MDVFAWLSQTLHPRPCTSDEFFYDEMASQSGYCLPVIYQSFDTRNRAHWRDRGALFDFLFSTNGEGKALLDFGPGDGWPSLIVAPFAREVTGVDGSQRRVEVCTENALRLGIANARFLHAPPGTPLPFAEDTFDGVMAASSVEQSPDPRATLAELYRVLRSGGRLRIFYESLSVYHGGRERALDLDRIDGSTSWLTFYDRHIEEEFAKMVRLKLAMPAAEVVRILSEDAKNLSWQKVSIPLLESLRSRLLEARACRLTHPSGGTFVRWMQEAGFHTVRATHDGAWFAGKLFDQIPAEALPRTMQAVDDLLRPLVKVVVEMDAPPRSASGQDPMITAVK